MIKSLSDPKINNSFIYGGKGASLGKLMQIGMKVPEGFVIPTNIVDIKNYETEILNAFDKLNCEFVAVRSSANAEDSTSDSFAGQFKTCLFVKKEDLLEEITECKKFLDSDRVKAYCEVKKIDRKKISLAIVVQKMVQSKIAGVCFTANPVSRGADEIIIEACYGLGEASVSGEITPDRYVIKNNKITKNISEQEKQLVYDQDRKTVRYQEVEEVMQRRQKMDDSLIRKLVRIARNVEKHYQKPIDIEWAIEGKQIYILQARPITTISSDIKQRLSIDPEKYDHLWDWGAPYLIAAIDQETFAVNGKWDFISHGVNNTTSLYISKNDRKILSEKGFKVYYTGYRKYETQVRMHMRQMEDTLLKMKNKNLNILSNKELADDFRKFVLQVYKIFEIYDLTECMYTDKVEWVIVNNDKTYELERLRENVKKMGEFKLEQRDLLNRTWDYKKGILADFLNQITKRLKLTYSPEQYHYKELIDLLLGKKIVIPDRSVWIRGKFSSWKDIVGEEAKSLINALSHFDKNVQTISGVTSNRGQYAGRVRKIEFNIKTNYEKEIAKMKKGEILVSGSTGPEMILACKKAGAIVAEEGGVISHAAIISRELGIPCITGTHIACKVLSNGDLVEVDADNGVVRILERAQR
jgi:phosphohistidine swiveling domain-containing protein